MSKYIKIKALKDLGSTKAGETVKILADDDGNPFDSFWRKRLKDAKFDSCCELVADKANKTMQPKKAVAKKSTN